MPKKNVGKGKLCSWSKINIVMALLIVCSLGSLEGVMIHTSDICLYVLEIEDGALLYSIVVVVQIVLSHLPRYCNFASFYNVDDSLISHVPFFSV